MANKGLKSYTKQLTRSCGNAGSISLNLSSEDKNMIAILPLTNQMGNCPFDLSVIFNPIGEIAGSLFGTRGNLNIMSYLYVENPSTFHVYHPDGTKEIFENIYEDGEFTIQNEESHKKMTIEEGLYVLTDKFGNKEIFDYGVSRYPIRIELKEDTTVYFEYDSETDVLCHMYKTYGSYKEEIYFDWTEDLQNISIIYYKENEVLKYITEISYDNNYISAIETKLYNGQYYTSKQRNEVVVTEVDGEVTSIVLKDTKTKQKLEVVYEASDYACVYETPNYNKVFNIKNEISYSEYQTAISINDDIKTHIVFDEDQYPLYETDEYGNTVKYVYDKINHNLVFQSQVIPTINKLEGAKTFKLSDFKSISGMTESEYEFESVISSTNLGALNPNIKTILKDGVYSLNSDGRFRYTISVEDGLPTDEITVVMWSKNETTPAYPFKLRVYTDVEMEKREVNYVYVLNQQNVNYFDITVMGIVPTKSYSNIYVELEFDVEANVLIGGFQLINKKFGAYYTYDSRGNMTSVTDGYALATYEYDEFSKIKNQSGPSLLATYYVKDGNDNYKLKKYPYGVEVLTEFNDRNQVTRVTQSTETGRIIIDEQIGYDESGKYVVSETDSLGNKVNYTNDSFGKVLSVTDTLGIMNYDYSGKEVLEQIQSVCNSVTTGESDFTYDSDGNISTVTLLTGEVYKFTYDEKSNVNTVKLNDILLVTLTYNVSNLIEKIEYGTESSYHGFKYYESGITNRSVKEINYYNTSGTLEVSHVFTYDVHGRLIKVKCGTDTIEYTYDNNNNVVRTNYNNVNLSTYNYNGSELIFKCNNVSGKKIYSFKEGVNRSKAIYPEIIETLIKSDKYSIEPFRKYTSWSSSEYNDLELKHTTCFDGKCLYSIEYDGNLTYGDFVDMPLLAYSYDPRLSPYPSKLKGSISFWFKPATTYWTTEMDEEQNPYDVEVEYDYNGKCVFSLYEKSSTNKRIYVKIENNKLVLYYQIGLTITKVIESVGYIDPDKWNFFSLRWMNTSVFLTLNCNYAYNSNLVEIDNDTIYYYGIFHDFDQAGNQAQDWLLGKITLLMASTNYLTEEEINRYYNTTKDYIEGIKLTNKELKTTDIATTSHIVGTSNTELFEIFPLAHDVKSLNGIKPIGFDLRETSLYDKDKSFHLNKDIGEYVYMADGCGLIYDFGMTTSGTILMDVCVEETNNKQYLFDILDTTGNELSFYRDSNNYLCISFAGDTISTGVTLTSNVWHKVGLSFKDIIESDSGVITEYKNFRVYLDGTFKEITHETPISLTKSIIAIGTSETGLYPLMGQVKMLAVRCAYCEEETITSFISEVAQTFNYKLVNELGMVMKTGIKRNNSDIISNTITYKTKSDNPFRYSKIIKKDTIKYGSTTVDRSYTTNVRGQVTSITDSVFGSKTYEYDDRGFLINDNGTVITYDRNGNITSYGENTYEYSGTIKDQLTKACGQTITYSQTNPFNPKSWNGRSFSWQGRRLVGVSTESLESTYKYNHEGLRISKTVNEITTNFYYEGTNLITLINPNIRLDFLYDDNQLYGLVYEGNTYYYVRDHLLNILGIVDTSGNLVVKYDYNAWGNNQTVTGTLASTLGHDNPFRYKGYYYDVETQLYWVSSRYYSPELCRWISPDSVEYLDPESINGLNLYAYCGNDPVNKYDPTGNFPILLAFILGGALIGGTLGGITAYSEGQDILTGVLTGALLGAAVGGIIGVGGVALSGAVSSVLGKTATDLISVAFYGGEFGSWEDYAIAFAFGGLTGSLGSVTGKFAGLAKAGKFAADVALRPAANQLIKMGTRGNTFNRDKYLYDVITRTVTYGGSNSIMKSNMFGLNLKVDLGKCFYRSTLRSLYSYI